MTSALAGDVHLGWGVSGEGGQCSSQDTDVVFSREQNLPGDTSLQMGGYAGNRTRRKQLHACALCPFKAAFWLVSCLLE